MLSSCLIKNRPFVNKSLQDYCRKTIEDATNKLKDKYSLERNKKDNVIDKDYSNKPNYNYLSVFLFLSITMFSLCFYKRLK